MKLFFYFLLFVFTVSNSIAKILPTLLVETEDKSKKLNQYVQKDSVFTEKDFIKQLFSLPVEYHQYVMPMVAEMPAISEKTRTMPGIVEWRRKLPQKVPLQLEDYAAENLKYLNPAYYPLLIPEAWDEAHGYEHNYNDKLPSNALDISTPKKMEATFPSYIDPKDNILDMMQVTPKLTDNNKLEKITAQNVASVLDIVSSIAKMMKPFDKNVYNLSNLHNDEALFDIFVNPCTSLVSIVKKSDIREDFSTLLDEKKMDEKEFTQKCDRIIKAYRLRKLQPAKAKEIVRLTYQAMQMPENSIERKLYLTISHLYRTNWDDIKALDGFENQIKETFFEKNAEVFVPFLLDI